MTITVNDLIYALSRLNLSDDIPTQVTIGKKIVKFPVYDIIEKNPRTIKVRRKRKMTQGQKFAILDEVAHKMRKRGSKKVSVLIGENEYYSVSEAVRLGHIHPGCEYILQGWKRINHFMPETASWEPFERETVLMPEEDNG